MNWDRWLEGISIGALAVNLVVIWYNLRMLRRIHQLYELLIDIAVASFMNAHRGTFIAWSRAMGRLRVNVLPELREPGDYDA